MLVLARKSNESFMIGDSIEVVVLDVKGDIVKLGISAPPNVSIYRKEIYEEILKENMAAAEMDVSLNDLSRKFSNM